ncbi:RNA-binding protein FUS [Rosa sericea]|nr:RNA-binding protein FUS [Rosa chinensis]
MNRPGDWNCRSCNHLNFQRRDSCQRCGEPRPGERGGEFGSFGGGRGGGVGGSFGFTTGPDVRPGDWYCNVGNCGAHNFASRSSCFKCGASKDESSSGGGGFDGDMPRSLRGGFGFGGSGSGSGSGGSSGRSGWKSGDWICTRLGCNEHNFASRTECFRCNAPRESSTGGAVLF